MTATDQRAVILSAPGLDLPMTDPETAQRMVAHVARLAVEVVRAQREVRSLSRVATQEVLVMLERRAALTRRLRGLPPGATSREAREPAVITGVRACVVSEDAVEASAVIREPGRARFLAMRWERRRSGWKVTVLELG